MEFILKQNGNENRKFKTSGGKNEHQKGQG